MLTRLSAAENNLPTPTRHAIHAHAMHIKLS
jgi:hypothetical protein